MKNKLVFRILGALASALIIVSLFIPFISVTGYSTSLWESFGLTNSLYLPIMIIVFGALGVVFFSLNIKTEFAYMSTGALTFFLIMQTIDILNQDAFNSLGIGYYTLIVGTFFTGLMAFLTNLKSKKKVEEPIPVLTVNEPTLLNQIDNLYNKQNEISPIQPITNVIEPIPVQPMVSKEVENVVIDEPIVQGKNVVSEELITDVERESQVVQVNPVLQEFTQPTNPRVQEFSNSEQNNSVMQEYSITQATSQESVQEQHEVQTDIISKPNPVLNQFTNPSLDESQKSSRLDIFGQN